MYVCRALYEPLAYTLKCGLGVFWWLVLMLCCQGSVNVLSEATVPHDEFGLIQFSLLVLLLVFANHKQTSCFHKLISVGIVGDIIGAVRFHFTEVYAFVSGWEHILPCLPHVRHSKAGSEYKDRNRVKIV